MQNSDYDWFFEWVLPIGLAGGLAWLTWSCYKGDIHACGLGCNILKTISRSLSA